jgi:hypothetical protein
VRDPVFAPAIDSAVDDPGAAPDPGVLASVQARVPQVLADCTSSQPS